MILDFLISLSLSFFICKMGTVTPATERLVFTLKIMYVNCLIYNRCLIEGGYFIVIGMNMMRKGSFAGGLDAMLLRSRGVVGRGRVSRICLPWGFWDVLPFVTKASLGHIGTNFQLSSFNFNCH